MSPPHDLKPYRPDQSEHRRDPLPKINPLYVDPSLGGQLQFPRAASSKARVQVPPPPLIKTRFLILSDTHSANIDTKRLPEVDVVLHCGDITEDGRLEDYEAALDYLSSIDAELKLVIPGNHDISLDGEFFIQEGGDIVGFTRAVALWKSEKARDAGIVFLDEGVHDFTLSHGAVFTVYATPHTPRYGVSAFQYSSGEDRFNPLQLIPEWSTNTTTDSSIISDFPAVDIIMSHGPPKYFLDNCADGSSGGCEHLRRAVCRTRPLLHCFGHVHRGWGVQRVAWRRTGNEVDSSGDEAETANRASTSSIEKESDDDDMTLLPQEFVGVNSSRKRGYATLSPGSTDAIVHGEQTVFVNAAIMDEEGEPKNVPWVLSLNLRTEEQCQM